MAVGSVGEILTSSDGTTWSSQNVLTSNTIRGVAYGNGTFVAVGASDMLTSSDGGTSWNSEGAYSSTFYGVTSLE